MFGFFIKKNFFDGWDNLWHIVMTNLFLDVVVLAVVAGICGSTLIPVPASAALYKGLFLLLDLFLTYAAIVIICWFSGADCYNCADIANFDQPSFKKYFGSLGKTFLPALALGTVIAFIAAILYFTVPYYYQVWKPAEGEGISAGGVFGLVMMIISFWFAIMALVALQWYWPVYSLMGNGIRKTFKKCFIIFLDNMGFSFAVAFNNILLLVLGAVTLELVPGMVGVLLADTNALRLRLYKYDWAQNDVDADDAGKKNIPWDDLLANDRETLGPRTLKDCFFPWKVNK